MSHALNVGHLKFYCGWGQEGGRQEKRRREVDSQGGWNWEKLRKNSQHFVIFCIRNGTGEGTTTERDGKREYKVRGGGGEGGRRDGKQEVSPPRYFQHHSFPPLSDLFFSCHDPNFLYVH